MCTAHTTAPQEDAPPPVGQRALVIKHSDSDDCIVGKPVVHGRLHVGELGVERVLGPGHMAGLVGSRDFDQRVGQIIGLKSHCHTYKWFHMCLVTIECWDLLQDADCDVRQCKPSELFQFGTFTQSSDCKSTLQVHTLQVHTLQVHTAGNFQAFGLQQSKGAR